LRGERRLRDWFGDDSGINHRLGLDDGLGLRWGGLSDGFGDLRRLHGRGLLKSDPTHVHQDIAVG
jgi:hypothetical protein